MVFSGKRAIAAAAFEPEPLRRMLLGAGFAEVFSAADGAQALRMVRTHLPDLIVADAILPGMDGPALAERVARMPLTVHPPVVLLTPPGLRVKAAAAGCIALEKPVREESLRRALEILFSGRRVVHEEKRLRAEKILTQLGVPEHCGREYLMRAIEIVWSDGRLASALTTKLYPMIAGEFGTDARRVERAMSHVIEEAWKRGEIEMQYALFKNTIDARRGCPTCGEMIAQIADILRWEGNA